ncbi:MAG: hypothetical protein B6D61_10940 [Bacteroidetes bacterium 4484_249]|nr:MAG: hypothetical protein B6D61_10940 [Bacteroidetes bacterium 4484_249]
MKSTELEETNSIIQIDSEIMGGTPCFRGTRVPIQNLFDFLEADEPLSEFLDAFPTVSRKQAVSVIRIAEKSIIEMAV